jgi:hypothetical protein
MPGYSGTPLPKKLGVKPGFHVYFANAPAEVQAELQESFSECVVHKNELEKNSDPIDFVMLFVKSRTELSKQFVKLAKVLTPAGMLWACWPKKSSKVATDLNEDEVRTLGLGTGLVDVKVCAVTEIWSGLKFVRRVKDRKAIQT